MEFRRKMQGAEESSKTTPQTVACHESLEEFRENAYLVICSKIGDRIIYVNQRGMYLFEKEKKSHGKLTYFEVNLLEPEFNAVIIYTDTPLFGCRDDTNSWNEMVTYARDHEGTKLDISDERIRLKAENKYCEFFNQAFSQYKKTQNVKKQDKVQEQLDLLK